MSWDVDMAIVHLQQHAFSHESVVAHKVKTGHCAQRTREAIEAGGLTLVHHGSAKDYGSSLLQVGFRESFAPAEAGDVVIIQPVKNHPHGHMAMFDGQNWISDFVQIDIWPGSAYRKTKPAYQLYRYEVPGGWPRGQASSLLA